MTITDLTIIGDGGSPYASETHPGFIPLAKVEDLFDFDARFSKMYVPDGAGGVAEIPKRKAVVHGKTGDVLNVVGNGYTIHQFRDVLLANVSALLDTAKGDLGILGAGLLDNGAVGWVQIAPSEGVVIEGDANLPTLTVVTSHSGKYATSYRTGLFRFRCSNQLSGSMRRRQQRNVYKIRHTRHSKMHLTNAREALGIMWETAATAADDIRTLIDTAFTDQQFTELVARLNPVPKPDSDGIVPVGSLTRWENRRDDLLTMWNTDERVGYRGTTWGAVQAFSTYRQHEAPFRGARSNTISRGGRNMAQVLAGHYARADVAVAEMALEMAAN